MPKKIKLVDQQTLTKIDFNSFLIWMYMDQADKALTDLVHITRENGLDKQMVKHRLTTMQKNVLEFREELYRKLHNTHKAELFGEASDQAERMVKMNMYMGLKEELGI